MSEEEIQQISSSEENITTDEEEKSLEELEQQLAQFNEQLQQCILLSEQEPESTEYSSLIEDLQNAINLTTELINIKLSEQQQTHSNTIVESAVPLYQEGDYCYGLYEGLWYVAVVTKIIDNTKKLAESSIKKPSFEYLVRYVGYGNSEFISKERYTIKDYSHPPTEYLQSGSKCLAVNANDPDGLYEDAVVDKLTEKETVWVTFKERGIMQEVPLRLIRLASDHFYDPKFKPKKFKKPETTSNTTTVASTAAATAITQEKKEQAEIIAKKKKKQEKRQAKQKEEEKNINERKQSWQSFKNKNSGNYKNTGKTLQSSEKTFTPAQKKTKHSHPTSSQQ